MKIYDLFTDMNTFEKLFIFLVIFLLITSILGWYMKRQESIEINLETFSDFKQYTNKNLYDKFYCNIYDTLFLSDLKNEYEIYNIKQLAIDDNKFWNKNDKSIKFLDLGCGTGNHIKIIQRYGYDVEGIDNSEFMVSKAKQQNPGVKIINDTILNKNSFEPSKFSHLTCFFYTVYYLENLDTFFKNCNNWLKPNGFLCLHLVNKKKFDPVLEKVSSLIPFYNPQKHTKKRNTNSKLIFNQYNYIADWVFPTSKGDFEVQFIENFIMKNGNEMRKNIHTLYMHSQKYYVNLAKKYGFELVKVIDLTPVNHRDNYIYLLRKKNGLKE